MLLVVCLFLSSLYCFIHSHTLQDVIIARIEAHLCAIYYYSLFFLLYYLSFDIYILFILLSDFVFLFDVSLYCVHLCYISHNCISFCICLYFVSLCFHIYMRSLLFSLLRVRSEGLSESDRSLRLSQCTSRYMCCLVSSIYMFTLSLRFHRFVSLLLCHSSPLYFYYCSYSKLTSSVLLLYLVVCVVLQHTLPLSPDRISP